MRIGIDALSVIPGVVGGSETYIVELLRAMLESGGEHKYVLFHTSTNAERFAGLCSPSLERVCVTFPSVPRVARIAGQQLVLPRLLRAHRVDVCFYPGSTMTLASPCPGVLTVQSLHPFLCPESFSATRRRYLRAMTARSVRRAAAIITPSQDARRAVIELLAVSPEKVFAVPEGVAANGIAPDADGDRAVLARLRLTPQQFVLCPSHFLPYKNLETLLDAFHILKSRYSLPHKLVVAGGKVHRPYVRKIGRMVGTLGLGADFVAPGMVPHHEIGALYRHAAVCVYPSRCETFGLPVLEAMACGVPVICSEGSALPEVAGKAAVFFPPLDFVRLSRAMHQMLSNPMVRALHVADGKRRAAEFGWRRAAEQTLEVIRRTHDAARNGGNGNAI
jgi:glycosyltransferase involved in cell wall biosynthesis